MTPHRRPSMRLLLALSAALFVVLAGVPAKADGPLSSIVKFEDRDYAITAAPWVSLEPETAVSVRKISYGRIRDVTIATTSTGTYSSDAMMSPHVLYPGIEVRAVPEPARSLPAVAGPGRVLFERPVAGASSIWVLSGTVLTTLEGGVLRSCVAQASILACHAR